MDWALGSRARGDGPRGLAEEEQAVKEQQTLDCRCKRETQRVEQSCSVPLSKLNTPHRVEVTLHKGSQFVIDPVFALPRISNLHSATAAAMNLSKTGRNACLSTTLK
jgi:hypothetical protein